VIFIIQHLQILNFNYCDSKKYLKPLKLTRWS